MKQKAFFMAFEGLSSDEKIKTVERSFKHSI